MANITDSPNSTESDAFEYPDWFYTLPQMVVIKKLWIYVAVVIIIIGIVGKMMQVSSIFL